MKRIDRILTQARLQTENEEFSGTSGISTDELIQYINDAQYRLQSLITAQHPTAFVVESTDIPVVGFQESYNIPEDALMGNKITMVEYSHSGREDDYEVLEPMVITERDAAASGQPSNYIRRSGKILLSPIPSSSTGTIRMNYVKTIPSLDVRRGSVASVVLDTVNRTITSLTLETDDNDFNYEALLNVDYISVCDRRGVQKMRRIPINSIDSTTGVVTVGSFNYDEGESISVGDYVVGGYDANTHPELSQICERYLVAYVAWKILKRDSSEDAYDQRNELKSIETDIVDAYADIGDDIIYVPIISED